MTGPSPDDLGGSPTGGSAPGVPPRHEPGGAARDEEGDMAWDEPSGEARVRRVRSDELVEADPTPGMRRRLAFAAPGLWAGTVETQPGAGSGWHHHGTHETSLYVVRGRMRLESGPGGTDVVEAGPGDFLHVPAGVVHRESNPDTEVSTAVIGRAGSGVPTVNVAGPDPA